MRDQGESMHRRMTGWVKLKPKRRRQSDSTEDEQEAKATN